MSGSDEAGALWMPSNNYYPHRSGHTPRWIIIHGTAGFTSAQEVGAYFQTADVATHYTVGRDATVVQHVAEQHGAWANGGVTEGHEAWWSTNLNPNMVTLSIEHVKPSRNNADEITEVQKVASFLLVRHLCERHAIPLRRADAHGGITGHYSMDPVNRDFCPGPYPWEELFAYLNEN